MTHQNHQTNGASLEDCHTNFFALTDLCGIKWRKFANGERPNASSDPLHDPILRSYSRCMQADILCVWRRVQSTKQDNSDPNALPFEISTSKVHPPLSLAAAKELWIFWYGEEPDLSELVDAELLKVAANQALWNGTWERGLTYECRSLLFKALHNLIERFVLTKDIVRFGKWFVQPCTSSDRLFGRSSQHLSFSFTFFVHGDTVCASIDLREHPAVRPLTKEHLAEAAAAYAAATASPQSHEQNSPNSPSELVATGPPLDGEECSNNCNGNGNGSGSGATNGSNTTTTATPKPRKVILAPFGMAATLTGNSYKSTDPMAEKILEDWASFFPLCNKQNSDVPPVVEVVSGGHKMYHPSIYVLVTDLDDMEEMEAAASQKGALRTTSSTEAAALAALSAANTTGIAGNGAATLAESAAALRCAAGGLKPAVTVASAALSSINNNSAALLEPRRTDVGLAKGQPYYDTLTSSFTCNTTNTHAPPQAATEMPDRAWQDCITNAQHVAYACANATTAAGANHTDDEGAGFNNNNNNQTDASANNNNNNASVDVKVPLQLQQPQQHLWDFVDPTQKAPCICTKSLAAAATVTPHGTPHHGGGASTYSRNSIGDSMPVPSVGSPGTPAPSPHPNSSLSQPTSVPPADQLLNMSPRAPTSVSNLQQPPTPIDHLLDKNTPAPTPTDQHDNKSITASPYVQPTPSVEAPPSAEGVHGNGGGQHGPGSVPPQTSSLDRCTPTPTLTQQTATATTPQQQQQQQSSQCGTISVKKFEALTAFDSYIKLEPGCAELTHNCSRSGGANNSTTAAETAATTTAAAAAATMSDVMQNFVKLYKPPKLTVKDIDSFANDDCLKLEALHDFTAQDAWANHPMKRFKPNEVFKPRHKQLRSKNLYEGHTHFKPPMPSPGSIYGAQLLSIDAGAAAHCSLNNSLDAAAEGAGLAGGGGGLVGIVAAATSMDTSGGGDGVDGSGGAHNFYADLDVKTEVLPGMTSPCKDAAKASVDGNLFTAEGLKIAPNLDMEDLFERSSNNECSSVQIHTPPDSNNPSNGCTTTNTIEELKRSTAAPPPAVVGVAALAALQNCNNSNVAASNAASNNSIGANTIQAEDLTKMFPTPPSHEQHHPNSSPCQMDIQMTDLSVITSTTLTATLDTGLGVGGGVGAVIKLKQEYSVELGSPVEEPIEDWSYVHRPPQRTMFVGSSKYAPLTNLPSQTLPPLVVPANSVYKPSWTKQQSRAAAAVAAAQQQQLQHQQQQQQHQQQHQQQQLHELLSAAPRTPLQQPRTPLGGLMPSPMHSGNTVPTPLSSGGGGSTLLLNQLNGPQAALTNTPGATMQQLMQRAGMSPISPAPVVASSVPFPRGSPMLQAQRQTPIHPPPPYELAVASPATSTSSYLNKQYHSQEPPRTPHSVGVHTHHGGPHSAAPHLASGGMCAASAAAPEMPEVSSLIVNILLYDTALNVFRDHNFDSSTVCVCNADSQKVGNIRGADSGVYVPLPGSTFNPAPPSCAGANAAIGGVAVGGASLRMLSAFGGSGGGSAMDSPVSLPGAGSGHTVGGGGSSSSSSTTPATNSQQHITGYVDDDPFECTCGFSAVVNRRLAYRAGLFYEDEMEITGIAEDPGRHKKQSLISLVGSLACVLRPASANALALPSSAGLPAAASKALVADKLQAAVEQQAHDIFDLLLEQCSIIQTSSSAIHRALQRHRRRLAKQSRQPQSIVAISNVLEFVDANDIMCLALEQARLAYESNRMDMNEFAQQHQLSPFHPAAAAAMGRRNGNGGVLTLASAGSKLSVHKWPYVPAGFTRSNKDIVRTMNSIQPMLQNAFHSKSRSAAGSKDAATYIVSGPLTWRQFHRLAGRASGQCEPQPIPPVIVGHDKDWISVAPLAIHYWDKFLLEPYAYARDVVYLIVCPDNDYVVTKTKTYFKELSSTYEMCKLGRHTPMRGWDGLLTVGGARLHSEQAASTPLDDWLRTLDDTALAEKLRLYAQVFQHLLAPYLNRVPNDKTLLNPPDHNGSGGHHSHSGNRERGSNSPLTGGMSAALHGVDNPEKPHNSPKLENNAAAAGATEAASAANSNANEGDVKPDIKSDLKPSGLPLSDPLGMNDTMEDINPPAIVLYVVEPFTFGCDSPELERLACIALLRCYSELLKSIPESVRANIHIQLISLESILELGCTRNRKRFSDEIKCLALNIFSQCRRHLLHAQTVKSLTGFGTAANMEVFLKSKDEKNRQAYKMYTPPYILAPVHEKNDKTDFSRSSAGMRGLSEQKYSVMYCNYCMSEDQSWLLATVTDDRGELLEKKCINIDVPNRTRRRKAPARRIGLKKLMDYIMGLISQTSQPWRLVIGRIGRIGHSELKSWSYLLSKQNLQKASKQLKDICKQCTLMYPPSILSACLVTLEPDAKLRVMPDQFTPDERFSQISMQNPLSTPQDVTCTHILVFPTSAVCLSFTRQFQNEPQVDIDNDFLNFEECEDDNEGFSNADLMGDLLGEWEPQMEPMSNHGSPDRLEDNRSWQSASGNNFNSAQQQDVEEVGSINQQPLAVGYMVSTAPTGRMPSWFWAACPHLEDVCPVFLKTALHLHVPTIQTTDDILNSTNAHSSATDHPLDSTLTADVLRYVLEGYNALSWLALDSNTHDRLSCLPINVQTLMHLYYLTAAIA